MPNALVPLGLVSLPVAAGATTPVPTAGAGAWIWSSSANMRLVWTGSQWSASGA